MTSEQYQQLFTMGCAYGNNQNIYQPNQSKYQSTRPGPNYLDSPTPETRELHPRLPSNEPINYNGINISINVPRQQEFQGRREEDPIPQRPVLPIIRSTGSSNESVSNQLLPENVFATQPQQYIQAPQPFPIASTYSSNEQVPNQPRPSFVQATQVPGFHSLFPEVEAPNQQHPFDQKETNEVDIFQSDPHSSFHEIVEQEIRSKSKSKSSSSRSVSRSNQTQEIQFLMRNSSRIIKSKKPYISFTA